MNSYRITDKLILKRITNGISIGFMGQCIGVIQRLILPVLFIRAWGLNHYGEWLLITALISNLALSEIGSSLYIINSLTKAYSEEKYDLYKRMFQSSITLFTIFPITLGLILIFSFYIFPELFLNKFIYLNNEVLTKVAIFSSLQICLYIPYSLLNGIYRTIGMLPKGLLISNILSFLQIAFVSISLYFNKGPIYISIMMCLPIILLALFCIRDLNKNKPSLNLFNNWNIDKILLFTIIKPSIKFFLIQLSLAMSIQGTVLVAGLLIGSKEVVIFSTMRTLANTVKSTLGIISNSMWPEFTRLDSQKKLVKLKYLFKLLVKTYISLTIFIGVTILILGEKIYSFWLKDVNVYNKYTMLLILVVMAIQIAWSSYANILMATNRHSELSYLSFLSSILTILFSYIGALKFGLNGMIFGIILSELIMLLTVPFIAINQIKIISNKFFIISSSFLIVIPLSYYLEYKILIPILLLLPFWWYQSYNSLKVINNT